VKIMSEIIINLLRKKLHITQNNWQAYLLMRFQSGRIRLEFTNIKVLENKK
jgi:hypothetical protein